MPMTLETLAQFARDTKTEDISPSAMHMAKKVILDLLAAGIAGHRSPAAQAALYTARTLFASGPATIWFTQDRLQPAAAAYVNATMASAMDLDDGQRQAMGHPGAAIIPAALAMAEKINASGVDLLAAIVVGYEVALRIAAARDHSRLDTLSSGRWCGFGAVAAAGRLLKLPTQQIAQAMAVSGVQAPGLSAAGYSRLMGNSAKEGIGWATLTGLTALDLATHEFTGPLDILDHPDYYDAPAILNGLGHEFAIEQIYFKPYSCCRWIHAAIDALLGIMATHHSDAQTIRQIDVHLFERALRLNNYPNPDCLEAAQYSVPFCLAAAARVGKAGLLLMDTTLLDQPAIIDLARRVNLIEDPQLTARFPQHVAARVVVHTATGQFQKQVDHPLGDPVNPMPWDALTAKLNHLAHLNSIGCNASAIIAAIERIETSRELFDLLAGERKTTSVY